MPQEAIMDDAYNIFGVGTEKPCDTTLADDISKYYGMKAVFRSDGICEFEDGTLKDTQCLKENIPHFCGRTMLNEEEYEGIPCRFCKSSTTWVNVCDNPHCNV